MPKDKTFRLSYGELMALDPRARIVTAYDAAYTANLGRKKSHLAPAALHPNRQHNQAMRLQRQDLVFILEPTNLGDPDCTEEPDDA